MVKWYRGFKFYLDCYHNIAKNEYEYKAELLIHKKYQEREFFGYYPTIKDFLKSVDYCIEKNILTDEG